MTDKAYASVWDAIEDTRVKAENMKLRSALMMEISEHVKTAGLNQTQAADLFAVTQPRISDLMRGKINLFSLDMLVEMLSAAGLRIELKICRPQAIVPKAKLGRVALIKAKSVRRRKVA